ncbi:hypothetical protein D5S18_12690 [Nocardia panacis]|uniref:Uncharacterized protein n=1 Tax=Nocardia panacis TaxID=2340916 RepID=A0A3A4KEB0_9NOCA|nr:hypothetical protein [Nocardia panacis]RJO77041.1 hypothetical protein D5S18_12690 [Nocardia panacis]
MSFRELLDTPFALIQANIAALAGVGFAALALVEVGVLGLIAAGSAMTDDSDGSVAVATILATLVGVWVLRFVLRGFTTALGVGTVTGAPLRWSAALGRIGANFGPLLAFSLLYTVTGVLLTVSGCAFGITLPFALWWLSYLRAGRFVALPVQFIEGGGHAVAVSRSKLLTSGMVGPTAGLWLVQRLLMGLTAVPLLGIPLYLSDFTGTHRWAVLTLITSAILLITAFGEVSESATRVVCYIDKRCRREGLDIRVPRTMQ